MIRITMTWWPRCASFLLRERAACLAAGIAREAIVLDPGIGFRQGDWSTT